MKTEDSQPKRRGHKNDHKIMHESRLEDNT